jgi:uncharacterized protein
VIEEVRLSEAVERLRLLDPTPRSGSSTNGQVESSSELLSAGENSVGLWSCTAGTFPSARVDRDEVCLILEGSGVIESDDGSRVAVGPGSLVLLPDGWSGHWHIDSKIVKVYLNLPRAPS